MKADSPSRVRSILETLGIKPEKRLGQNFLCDGNWIRKVVESIPAGWPIVEIGPGLGGLTGDALDRGHRVQAVEIDPRLCQYLQSRFTDRDLNVVEGDAVMEPLGQFTSEENPFALLSNLPFSITSPWIDSLLRSNGSLPDQLSLILQQEGLDRMQAAPRSKPYGPTAIRMSLAYDFKSSQTIPASAFYPSPSIESIFGIWTLRDRPRLLRAESIQLLRRFFGQRRKMIRRAMKECLSQCEITRWTTILESHDLSPTVRAEEIDPELWWRLLEKK